MIRRLRFTAAMLAAALAGGVGAVALAGVTNALDRTTTVESRVTDPAAQAVAARTSGLTINEIYRRSAAGVVEITVESPAGADAPFGQGATVSGSGFVIDRQGHIVTNQHVVEDADSVTVTFAGGGETVATVVGTDPSTDLALLRVEPAGRSLTPLTLAPSTAVEVGDPVVAIGNPFGLEGTATSGIVSALDREIEAPNGFVIDRAIQTDAALNGGNSGGPLLDARGRVIGVNSQIRSETGGNVGIGYAVASDTVRAFVADLEADGEVEHAYLGVAFEATAAGVRVTEVRSGSPAARAGLRGGTEGGDLVTALDGEAIETPAELRAAVSAKQPGDTLTLEVRRDGSSRTVTVELGRRPETAS